MLLYGDFREARGFSRSVVSLSSPTLAVFVMSKKVQLVSFTFLSLGCRLCEVTLSCFFGSCSREVCFSVFKLQAPV